MRRGERASGEDEVRERRELALHRVDALFELRDALCIDALEAARARRREVRTDVEEISLDLFEHVVDFRGDPARASDAEKGRELVDGAVGFDAREVFRNARP